MSNIFLLAANWKMNKLLKEVETFCAEKSDELLTLADQTSTMQLALFPSSTSLYPMQAIFKNTHISYGGQDCSSHLNGNFTAQTSAEDLAALGCSYCIVGHSEVRALSRETNDDIARKVIHLLDYNISPILCIGENKADHSAGKTVEALEAQLAPVIETLNAAPFSLKQTLSLNIAYEPLWAIGTGEASSPQHVEIIFSWLNKKLAPLKKHIRIRLMYGGSVSPENLELFLKVPLLEGVLVGGASVKYENLEKLIRRVASKWQ